MQLNSPAEIKLGQRVKLASGHVLEVTASLEDNAFSCFKGMLIGRMVLSNGKLGGMRHNFKPSDVVSS